ncbi:MAG: YebC/PmpR family DNA-binding transcriptional regulator [Bdellovibrio sp.]
MGRKWNNIKDKKADQDRARAQAYTKLLRDITRAAKNGDNPESNFLLKIALDKAKKGNVPRENIERAIKKGAGGDDEGYEDITYEGYGPSGVAIFIEASTNNVTRTAGNVRSYFNKYGGSLGTTGCLQFVFEHKAVFEIPGEGIDEERLTLELIDVGAEDIEKDDEGYFIVKGPMESFGPLSKKLEEMGIKPEESGLERLPLNFKKIDKPTFEQIMKLINTLENDDDVNKVYHNIEFDQALFD